MKVAKTFTLSFENVKWLGQTSNASLYIDQLLTKQRTKHDASQPMTPDQYVQSWEDKEKERIADEKLAKAQEELKLLNEKLDLMNVRRDKALEEGNDALAEEIKLEMLKITNPKRYEKYLREKENNDQV